MDILIGADPEIFVTKNGELVSAHGLIEGTKKEPKKIAGGAVQVDGMALEFNIEPASNYEQFAGNIQLVMHGLKAMVPEHDFAIIPTAHFGRELIEAQPEEARALGCEPDYNAYTGLENPKPDAQFPFRTASGHIHIGWTKDMDPLDPEHFEACRMVTKQLDVTLGLVSRLWDTDTERRTLYGDLGAFRPKPYGVEYRVLSNLWLTDPHLIKYVYTETIRSVNNLLDGLRYYRNLKAPILWKNVRPTTFWDVYQGYGNAGQEDIYNFFSKLYKKQYEDYLLSTASRPQKVTLSDTATWQPLLFGVEAGHIIGNDVDNDVDDDVDLGELQA